MRQAPDRLTVPTCIGCGAMAVFGTCQTGCGEQRLELIRADAHAALLDAHAATRRGAETFGRVAERLERERPAEGAHEAAYRSVQDAARVALREHPPECSAEFEPAAEPSTTWWCAQCGGIDAPQPCLGICVWRSVEWVNRGLYERDREAAIADFASEQRLRRLLRRAAFVTPRPGQWERAWQVLQVEAREIGAARG